MKSTDDPNMTPRLPSAENPAERISAESEKILTRVQFSPQGGNGTVVRIFELESSDNLDILNSPTNLAISAPDG